MTRPAAATLLVDTHVHFYPDYDRVQFWQHLRDHYLASAGAQHATTFYALILTERMGCRFFADLLEGGEILPNGWRVVDKQASGIRVAWGDALEILLIPGRQLDTLERLEVLAVGAILGPDERLNFEDSLAWAEANGKAVVLPWAFGKWLFGRAKIIKNALVSGRVHAVSDSAMRPYGWPFPKLLKFARKKNLPVWAGSDPLPQEREECRVGQYLTAASWQSHRALTPEQVLAALLHPSDALAMRGRRLNLFQVLKRSI